MVPFTNAFKYNTLVTKVYLNLYHNTITTFTLQESFITLTKLTTLNFYAGPNKSKGPANYQNYTFHNSNINYITVFLKKGNFDPLNSSQMFANMPKLKTVYIIQRDDGYNYADLKAIVDACGNAPAFTDLSMQF